jgi:hypothetical protein
MSTQSKYIGINNNKLPIISLIEAIAAFGTDDIRGDIATANKYKNPHTTVHNPVVAPFSNPNNMQLLEQYIGSK